MFKPAFGAAFAAFLLAHACAARADAIDAIRAAHRLDCAVSIDTDDFSTFDSHGDISKFAVDHCRALAAALLGDPSAARIHAEHDELTALLDVSNGRAQVAIAASPDIAIGLARHLAWAPPVLIDGMTFVVDGRAHIASAADLKGSQVCSLDYTPATETLISRMGQLGVTFLPAPYTERGEMESALAAGRCPAVAADATQAANIRLSLPTIAQHDLVLPSTITTDPVSPAVHAGEDRLLALVTAVDGGLVTADELGVTQANAADLAAHTKDPWTRRLLGADPWIGKPLGTDERFLRRAILAEGSASEIFRRDLGAWSPLKLPVGANKPVSSGGALVPAYVGEPR